MFECTRGLVLPKAVIGIICLSLLAATTQPSTKPSVDFVSIDSILSLIPNELVPKTNDGWTDLKMDEINRLLRKSVDGKSFALSMRVAVVREDDQLNCIAVTGMCLEHFGKFGLYLQVPRNDQTRRMMLTIDANSNVAVRGILRKAEFTTDPGNGHTIFILVGESSDIRSQH